MSRARDWATLGEVCNEPVEQSGLASTSDFVYIDIGSIDRSQKVIVTAQTMSGVDAPSRARQRLSTGDVLVSMTRPNLNAVAIVPAKLDGAIGSTGFHVLRSKHMVSQYLYFLVQSQEFVHAMCAVVQGALYPAVRPSDIGAFQMRIPSRAEQTRIVDKLEELLSDLDAGVAELKAAQKKLAQYRQSLLKAAVEGRLTEAWRAQHGEPAEGGAQLLACILRERSARWEARQLAKFLAQGKAPTKGWQDAYPLPTALDTSGLPELPQGWVWSSLGQCFHVGVGATPSRKQPEYWGGDTPWVSSGEVRFNRVLATKEQISSLGLQNSSTRLNPIGSVMLGMIGEGKTRGQAAILDIEAANNQNCAAIWVPETDIAPEYIYYWLWSRYDETRRGSSGNNQPALNKSIVEAIPFPLPPLSELAAVVALVEVGMAEASSQEAALEHALRQSAAQRKNILQAAFSGQLVPQDPNDEPASVLLARIRAERVASDRTRTGARRTRRPAAAA